MPKDKPVAVEKPRLPAVPTWKELKADAGFQEWFNSPYLRQMAAALRASYVIAGATDPHAMIREGGIQYGYLFALTQLEDFCKSQDEIKEGRPKRIPYEAQTSED